MKTLVIILSMMAITMAVYGFDINRLRKFKDNFKKCTEEFGGLTSEPRAETLKCALAKDGRIMGPDGAVIREEALKSLEDVISDSDKLNQAKAIFNKCFDDMVQSGETGDEQAMKYANCTLTIMFLLE